MPEQNKKSHFRARKDAIADIEHQIIGWRSPKHMMAVLVLIAGMIGFVASVLLLKCGVMSMAVRYAFALLAGYLTLCASLWLWTGSHPKNIEVDLNATNGVKKTQKNSKFTALDYMSVPNLLPSSIIDLELMILIVLFVAVFWLVYSAPTLMAELTLDSVVSLQVYHRIRQSERHRYLSTFWRVTWLPLLCMFILVVGGAWVLQHFVPEAHTLWQVIRKKPD
jgi:sorbitol-specific phosphotransferase system component IIC